LGKCHQAHFVFVRVLREVASHCLIIIGKNRQLCLVMKIDWPSTSTAATSSRPSLSLYVRGRAPRPHNHLPQC
jgi:hypothetical protein